LKVHTTSAALSHLRRAVKIGAVIVLVASALLSNFAHLKHLLRVNPPPNEVMARRDQRFELLRDALPKRGTVGYLSDAASWTDQQTHLLLAQFALAPLILVEGADQPLVVGEFSDPAAVAKGRDLKLTVVRDLGDGLVLFARPSQ
jgi:hypothetical protein